MQISFGPAAASLVVPRQRRSLRIRSTAMPRTSSTRRIRIYLVEPDAAERELQVAQLGEMGFDAEGFGDAPAFYRAQAALPCDVAVIDVALPGEDGFSVAAHLRATSHVGIVILTERGSLPDRLHGLRQGADAYLVKPVHRLELSALLGSLGRRVTERMASPTQREAAARWQLLDAGWTLRAPSGRTMPLTATERSFLQCLFAHPERPVSRDALITALGGDRIDFDPHRIDSLASRLRRKAIDAGMPLGLRSVRGLGYVFHLQAEVD